MRFCVLPFMFLCAVARGASEPTLLVDAVDKWLGERDHWAFTQRAVEYENEKPRERLERYDPSLPAERRWTLLAIDGKAPTAEQRDAWAKKKFKKSRRKFDSPIGDLFDFKRARMVGETAKVARYDVPLRSDKSWLFPVDKVRVIVTVNKEHRALEHLNADVREPFKVLLGLAKITGGALDLSFDDDDGTPGPDTSPTGSARVSVSKFGERAEFTWSDFKRVTPFAGSPGKAVSANGP
jgi:hypothetical protein